MLYIIVVVLYIQSFFFHINFNAYYNYAEPQMHPKCVLTYPTNYPIYTTKYIIFI